LIEVIGEFFEIPSLLFSPFRKVKGRRLSTKESPMQTPAIYSAPPSQDDYVVELATIFATAILRLNVQRRRVGDLSTKLSESSGKCLEFSATTRLNGRRG
jgi:hypothetical protein